MKAKLVHYKQKKEKHEVSQKEVIDNVIEMQKDKYDQLIRKYEDGFRQNQKAMNDEINQLKYLLKLRDQMVQKYEDENSRLKARIRETH